MNEPAMRENVYRVTANTTLCWHEKHSNIETGIEHRECNVGDITSHSVELIK